MIKSLFNHQEWFWNRKSKVTSDLSTVGIDIHSIELKDVKFSVWDFAGQMEYHNFHHVRNFIMVIHNF